MDNPDNSARRIIGVRTSPAGNVIFCEAGEFSPKTGEWVTVEGESGKFPAQVALPSSLIETAQLEGNLPKVVGMGETIGFIEMTPAAVESEVSRKFEELSAANDWPYTLKGVTAFPDRLIVKFSAKQEPTSSDYVLLLKTLAVIAKTRAELFLVSEDWSSDKSPVGPELVDRVNALLKPLDPTILTGATVGEPLLDESEVYHPGQRPAERLQRQVLRSEAEQPTAIYDLVGKIWVNGVELAL